MVLNHTEPMALAKKTYRPPRLKSEKILVSNLFATQCTTCTPLCPQLC